VSQHSRKRGCLQRNEKRGQPRITPLASSPYALIAIPSTAP
jgi:hypothetical protein